MPAGAPQTPERLVDHDVESPLSEGDLICNLCEEYLAPAVLNTIANSDVHHDAVASMEVTLQQIIKETESHVHQPLFHQFVESHLWDEKAVISLAALQRVHHKYPHRSQLMERLVDHVVCSCRSHAWATDRVFERMLERYTTEEFEELRKIGAVGRAAHPSSASDDVEQFVPFNMAGRVERPPPKNSRDDAYAAAAGMPEFAGIGTGAEVQGGELEL